MAKDAMRKEEGGKEKGGKERIVAAIRRASAELGRAPSRGELRRITGVSHYRVLAEFPTLREAVRAAGLEPNPKGEKISTEDLLADWKRVAEKLGRRPSRAEYVREGKYSAGALTVRFGSWSGISTAKDAKGAKEIRVGRELTRKTRMPEKSNHKGHQGTQRESRQFVLHNFDRMPLAAVPAPVVGMRRVTEEVAQMVVNTLMGGYWPLAIGQNQEFNHKGHEGPQRENGIELVRGDFPDYTTLTARGVDMEGDLGPSLAIKPPLPFDSAQGSGLRSPVGKDDDLMRRDLTRRDIKKDRPVMGDPFDRSPMTNAPVNELGVMVLFGMVAARLGLQVESVQGRFPDCVAKRQVAPGKWQHLRIEFEYESKNFKLHGHDPKGCDMIVCWKHNWKDCPAEIEVIELCRMFGSN
ncbi:MAG TPA: hypothetical protein VGK21_14290 [Candidatus Angelobacter sp.]|jgi:hypothetical protein